MTLRYLFLALLTIICSSNELDGQIGRLALSPLQTIEQVIGRTQIKITYCRPSARGRVIFGGLVPYDEYWRTGANKNTKIEIDQPFYMGGQKIDAGTYTLFTKPTEREWEIFIHEYLDQYGLPDTIDPEKIIARMVFPSQSSAYRLENLNIGIENFTNYDFNLAIAWEDTKVVIPFQLNTREVMDKVINDVLGGPSYNDYYAAAIYELESGYNFERGLEWMDKAIGKADPVTFWDYRVKAYLLSELDRKEEAKTYAVKGLVMAKAIDSSYGIAQFEGILRSLE